MKSKIALLLLVCLMALPAGTVFGGSRHRHHDLDHDRWYGERSDHISIDMKHGAVVIEHREGRDRSEVEITEEYELFIDGKLVATDQEQEKLLKEYHTLVVDIHDYAKEIGWEGARIGVDGAKIGLQAGLGVLKMLFTSYDDDDLNRDLDRATAKIEKRAEALEDKADIIEDMADDLEDLTIDLSEAIPELAELEWF